MPTYQYRCTSCERELEVVQKFTDDALTTCPACSGNLRKVFNAVGVVFKGSGFYATDNRPKGKHGSGKSEKAEKSEKSAEKTEKSGKSEKSDSKPASDSKPKSDPKPSSSTGASSAA